MKLIIDIPEEVYSFIIRKGHVPYGINVAGYILYGEVLPDDLKEIWKENDDD